MVDLARLDEKAVLGWKLSSRWDDLRVCTMLQAPRIATEMIAHARDPRHMARSDWHLPDGKLLVAVLEGTAVAFSCYVHAGSVSSFLSIYLRTWAASATAISSTIVLWMSPTPFDATTWRVLSEKGLPSLSETRPPASFTSSEPAAISHEFKSSS